ncbi:MAG: NAD(P)/FAD-dependent oxidoreductase [Gammaproteobacteria bacterium]
MAHVVILGAGLGGMPAAYEMRALLGSEHRVTVINERPDFQFVPSNPWIAVGWRKRPETSFPVAPQLAKRGIDFIGQRATAIDPVAKTITLADGSNVAWDHLIITTGPRLAFEATPGAGPHGGHTQSVCTLDHAEKAHEDFLALAKNPGPVIVGALPGASCFGPAYEYALILDTVLKKQKIRDRVPITFVTAEPYIGHLGLGGVGDSKGMLESEFRSRHIKWITNAKTTKVEAGKMFVDELDDAGNLKKQHELPFVHSMMIPAFTGVEAVANVEGLCNPKGFVLINDYHQSPKYPEIWSAGVCVAIPPVETTPVPCGTPKTGYMIESMVTAIVHNIADALAGKPPSHKGTLSALCLADMGDTGAAFVAIPQIPPRNVTWFRKGLWVHWAKIAFEKYFIYKMKTGSSEPFYEKSIMRLLGITRLKDRT